MDQRGSESLSAAQFVQVCVPLKLSWVPYYCSSKAVRVGESVEVRFGRRVYLGAVWKDSCEDAEKLRRDQLNILPVIRIRKEFPPLSPKELRLWEFVCSYYMCSPCEVFRAARPMWFYKSLGMLSSRREKLLERIEKKKQSLLARHSDKVRSRLESELHSLEMQSESCLVSDSEEIVCAKEFSATLVLGKDRTLEYAAAIRVATQQGGQVLVLSPEAHMCAKMKETLGKELEEVRVLSCSSEDSLGNNAELLSGLYRGESLVVCATKAGVFLPFRKLSLIIIDNEQDAFYKNSDSAPRYNARDVAVVLASIWKCPVILGSNCPSLESLQNARSGKYALVGRTDSGQECMVVDIAAERRKNGMIGVLSRKMLERIRKCKGKAVLIRGWEKPSDIEQMLSLIGSEAEVEVLTFAEFRKRPSHSEALIGILGADALFRKEDFRVDEKAMQLVNYLSSFGAEVIIQTLVPERFSLRGRAEDLLEERRQFGYPPFSRIVDVIRESDGAICRRVTLAKGSNADEQKQALYNSLGKDQALDVDPL